MGHELFVTRETGITKEKKLYVQFLIPTDVISLLRNHRFKFVLPVSSLNLVLELLIYFIIVPKHFICFYMKF